MERLSAESPEHIPVPVPDPPAVEALRPARAKPWTADELRAVRDCGSAYMEGDTPPDNFPSNCELAADGRTAAEVIAYLESKFAQKRYRRGESRDQQAGTGFTLSSASVFPPVNAATFPSNPPCHIRRTMLPRKKWTAVTMCWILWIQLWQNSGVESDPKGARQ